MARRSGSEKRQRTTIVTMRISPQEAAAIRQLAQKRGRDRQRADAQRPPPQPPSPRPH